jgi:hypothetical protein
MFGYKKKYACRIDSIKRKFEEGKEVSSIGSSGL